MEVAGQWRREWAGTAEYGKVTEGGVTRRVARAMEVLHASAPGARMRVMRAAYHSSSGPGIPASSYMLHSSRRVISSGFNILESPTFPSKPLEISSMPLESSPESNLETENYKVTEPDDMDISEPSKWRGTTSGNSIRMPSEESSSTDNASIIDLDSRLHNALNRKYSYDSESSDVHSLKRNSVRSSPLLDAPVTLSTLKYKSLLNNSSDWNNRRKSYSFEDTSPLNEVMVQSNDTLAMESSTDSGICKSTEIVNDCLEDSHNLKDLTGREKRYNINRDDSIDNWHFKNKPTNFYKGSKIKSYHDHDTVIEQYPLENNIALQSTGKLTITVPITIEGENDKQAQSHNIDDSDRKVKKVEFCKTELHFAAESGRVNIIATDEKPPPSNDFRKRRSAFVPINDMFEKPITLFGEKNEPIKTDEFGLQNVSETEFDENTAATKSILKNKIPKPKPYLLGENMAFGNDQEEIQIQDNYVSKGVSLVNKELETQRIGHCKETFYKFTNSTNKSFADSLRPDNKGPSKSISSNIGKQSPESDRFFLHAETNSNSIPIQRKLNALQMSPVPKPKTRQLRESDLTFFGIDNYQNTNAKNKIRHNVQQRSIQTKCDVFDDTFESVRLIKQISSSAQNSEAESDDLPEYQNIPMKTNFAPVPIPRSRVKYKKPDDEVVILKPIIEQVYDSSNITHGSRRSRSRKQDELEISSSRSRSEPAKNHKIDAVPRYNKQGSPTARTKGKVNTEIMDDVVSSHRYKNSKDDSPLYANLEARRDKKKESLSKPAANVRESAEQSEANRVSEKKKRSNKSFDPDSDSLERKQNSASKNNRIHRTIKLSTPDNSSTIEKITDRFESPKTIGSMNGSMANSYRKKEHRNIRHNRNTKDNELLDKVQSNQKKENKKYSHNDSELIKDNHTLKEKGVKNNEYSKSSKSTDKNSSDYRILSKELRPANKDGTERNSRRTSKSEYVIKYDDKNGTVSSISKVRSGHSASRQKHSSKERNKQNSKEMKTKSKNIEKTALRNAVPRSSECERKKPR